MLVLLYICCNISVNMYMFEKVMYMCMYAAICVWVCMCAQMFVYQHIDIYAVHILCIYKEKISMHVCICEYICVCICLSCIWNVLIYIYN